MLFLCNGSRYVANSAKELIGKLALVLIDEVQNLGESRGPALEAVVSRMKVLRQKNPMRFVGT